MAATLEELRKLGPDSITIHSLAIKRAARLALFKDEYQEMGEKLSKVDELLIISKATFGSYSSVVKNVLDRSISYVSPYFTIRNGEMHHMERYHKNLKVSAVFYGEDITEQEKDTSVNLVEANAVNLNGTVGYIDCVDSFEIIKEVL